MLPTVVSLSDKLAGLTESWVPTIIGALNGLALDAPRHDAELALCDLDIAVAEATRCSW